jgi:hypothetical protein
VPDIGRRFKRLGRIFEVFHQLPRSSKISSIDRAKSRAALKASGKFGLAAHFGQDCAFRNAARRPVSGTGNDRIQKILGPDREAIRKKTGG